MANPQNINQLNEALANIRLATDGGQENDPIRQVEERLREMKATLDNWDLRMDIRIQTLIDQAIQDRQDNHGFVRQAMGGVRKIPLPTVRFTKESEDWLVFRRAFKLQAEMYGYDDLLGCKALATCMRGEAARIIQDIPVEALEGEDPITIDQLLDEYEARFMPESSSSLAITAFERSSQMKEETLLTWHGRCRDLFVHAFPQVENINLDVTLIRKFQEGIYNRTVKYHLTRSRPRDYVTALTTAQNERAALMANSFITTPR